MDKNTGINAILKKNRYQSIKMSHAIRNNSPVVIVGKCGSGKTLISNHVIDRHHNNIVRLTKINHFIKNGGSIKNLVELLDKDWVGCILIEAQTFNELDSVYNDLIDNKFVFVTM